MSVSISNRECADTTTAKEPAIAAISRWKHLCRWQVLQDRTWRQLYRVLAHEPRRGFLMSQIRFAARDSVPCRATPWHPPGHPLAGPKRGPWAKSLRGTPRRNHPCAVAGVLVI